MAADYVTRFPDPTRLPRGVAERVSFLSRCFSLQQIVALDMFPAGSLKVIIRSVTSVTLQWPSFDGNRRFHSHYVSARYERSHVGAFPPRESQSLF
jgi:hypothetical protein